MAVIDVGLLGTTDVTTTDLSATLDIAAAGVLNIDGSANTVDVASAIGLSLGFSTYIGGGDTERLESGVGLAVASSVTLGEAAGGAAAGGSTLKIGAGGLSLDLGYGVAFEGGGNTLILDSGTSATLNVLSAGTMTSTDAIVLKGVSGATQAAWVQNTTLGSPSPGGTLDLENGSGAVVGSVVLSSGTYAAGAFQMTAAPGGGVMAGESVACFHEGTRIATGDGEVAVEALAVGGRVRTADGGLGTVRWLGRRRVSCRGHARPVDVWPVRIERGAFAPDVPRRTLLLSPDHAVLVAQSLIPARYLVNGASIRAEPRAWATYWHVELERHDILLAEGLACESYLDTGNRGTFENGFGGGAADPESALRVWEEKACAPLVLGGAVLARARAGLLARAEALGHRRTGEAAPILAAGGRRVAPLAMGGGWLRFRLDEAHGTRRLVSRSFVPAEMEARGRDARRLGIAVGELIVDGAAIALNDARLGEGWYAVEDGGRWRWTDGDAALDFPGARTVALRLAMTGTYWATAACDAAQGEVARAG